MSEKRNSRRSISKNIRFELFKRDSFKCQYCGASAPDVLLQVDHIKPISKGGTDDLTNLITACADCNVGKRDKTLDDKSVIAKQRAQLEKLQERREQLEMMMAWREELRNITEETVDRLCSYWDDLAPGFTVSESGRNKFKQWIRKFSLDELMHAMAIAAEQYLEFKKTGSVTPESWDTAFSKIPGICRVERASKDDPDIKELFYIRGILRNKIQYYYNDSEALKWLKVARSWNVPMEGLRQIAHNSTSWTKFMNAITKAIEYQEQEDKD